MELCEKYNLDVMDINPRLIKASPLLQKRIDEVHELILQESSGIIWTSPNTSSTTGGSWTSGSTYTGTTASTGTAAGSYVTFTPPTTSGSVITQWAMDNMQLRLTVDGDGNISAYSIDEEELE